MPQDGDEAVSLQEVRDKSREMDLEIAEQMGHPGTGIADMARQAVSDIDQQVVLRIPSYFWNQVLKVGTKISSGERLTRQREMTPVTKLTRIIFLQGNGDGLLGMEDLGFLYPQLSQAFSMASYLMDKGPYSKAKIFSLKFQP